MGINDINENILLISGVFGKIAEDITSVNKSAEEMPSVNTNIKKVNAESLSKLPEKLMGMEW